MNIGKEVRRILVVPDERDAPAPHEPAPDQVPEPETEEGREPVPVET